MGAEVSHAGGGPVHASPREDHGTVKSTARMYALAGMAGAVFGLAWSPFDLAPFFPLSLLLAMRALRHARTAGQAIRVGIVFEVAKYLVGAQFLLALIPYTPLSIVFYGLTLLYAIPFGAAEAGGAWWLERATRLPRSVGFGLLFALMEWIRTLGPLSFPADLAAHGFGIERGWLIWSAWIGPYGVTLTIVAIACLCDLAMQQPRSRRTLAVAMSMSAVILWFAPSVLDAWPRAEPAGNTLAIGIVQPSTPVGARLDPRHHGDLWDRLERLTFEAADGSDLVVWPEAARPSAIVWRDEEPFHDDRVAALARRAGVPILYGTEIARVHDGELAALYNGAAIAYPDDRPADWYGKQRLLPFVEEFPFASWFGRDPHAGRSRRGQLTLMGRFSPGPRPTLFEVDGEKIGVLICYEGMYTELAARYRRDGATMLAVITNDAWWGDSTFAPWHAEMIATRAREVGLPVVRAANNGVSSLTASNGQRIAATSHGDITTLRLDARPAAVGTTWHATHPAFVPVFLLTVLGLGVAIAVGRRVLGVLRDSRASRYSPYSSS